MPIFLSLQESELKHGAFCEQFSCWEWEMCAQLCLSSLESSNHWLVMGNIFSSYHGVRALDPGESKNQRAPWGVVTHAEELEGGGQQVYLGVSPRFRQQAHFSALGGDVPTIESHSTTYLPLPTERWKCSWKRAFLLSYFIKRMFEHAAMLKTPLSEYP